MKKLSLLILIMLLLTSCGAKIEEKPFDTINTGSNDVGVVKDEVNETLPKPVTSSIDSDNTKEDSDDNRYKSVGPKFPVCWFFKFSDLPELEVGKEIPITISIGSTLFDMEGVELIPKTGNELVLVSGEKWKGDIKKGQSHDVNIVVKPTKKGFNGIYGVQVIYPDFYKELKKYIKKQKQGPYKDDFVKEEVIKRINGMEGAEPDYEEWVGTTLEIK